MGKERTDEPRDEPQANRRLTVAQAAAALGINEGAVRSRIKRGTLPTVKEAGTVYVLWDDGTSQATQSTDTAELSDQPLRSELVESLQDQVTYLRNQLEAEREAGRRKDHLLAAALERIPAIEAPRDEAGGAEGGVSDEGPPYGTSRQEAEESLHTHEQRSWLYRFFFGP